MSSSWSDCGSFVIWDHPTKGRLESGTATNVSKSVLASNWNYSTDKHIVIDGGVCPFSCKLSEWLQIEITSFQNLSWLEGVPAPLLFLHFPESN
jgi:hypothetical protein